MRKKNYTWSWDDGPEEMSKKLRSIEAKGSETKTPRRRHQEERINPASASDESLIAKIVVTSVTGETKEFGYRDISVHNPDYLEFLKHADAQSHRAEAIIRLWRKKDVVPGVEILYHPDGYINAEARCLVDPAEVIALYSTYEAEYFVEDPATADNPDDGEHRPLIQSDGLWIKRSKEDYDMYRTHRNGFRPATAAADPYGPYRRPEGEST